VNEMDPTGAVIRSARKQAGLTLGQLAERIGISQATLSRVETGKVQLTPERLRLSSAALGMNVADLAQRDTDRNPATTAVGGAGGDTVGSWRLYEPLPLHVGLRAALELFVEVGYHGTAVRDVAKRAGISVPGLYHHYPGKQDLLVAIMDLTMGDFHSRCVAAQSEARDGVERFRLLIECFALFHSNRRELAFIGASEMRSLEPGNRRRIDAVRNSCQSMVTDAIEELNADGHAAADDPRDTALALVTMLIGIANWYRPGGSLTPEDVVRRYIGHAERVVALRSPLPTVSRAEPVPRVDGPK
jgi:TetR/AcrR family transcriptional regulator, cholesterol catabolism regulator